MSGTLLSSVFAGGGRASRYAEFTIITMQGTCFATTPVEFEEQQTWALARASSGDTARDCALFVDGFQTVIGREGSGIISKGSRMALQRLIRAMKASTVFMKGWQMPPDSERDVARTPSIESPA